MSLTCPLKNSSLGCESKNRQTHSLFKDMDHLSQIIFNCPGMAIHAFNTRTWEAEAGGSQFEAN
jgi:hypothetical protein